MPENDGTPQQPMNPDLMGYPSVEALVSAKRAGDAEAKRLFDDNQKKDALISQFVSNASAPNGRHVPERRNDSPSDRLTQYGVPVDALDEYMEQRVNEKVQAVLGPITRGVGARKAVVNQHPDYLQFEQAVSEFIETDPDLSARYPKMFEADPAGAIEYAFLKFGDSRRRSNPPTNSVTVGNVADAQLPTSRAGDSRRAPDDSQQLQELYERFQKTGNSRDAARYAQARLHTVIKDDHLNQ